MSRNGSARRNGKSSRTAQLIALQSHGRARWSPRDTATLAREGYMKNAIVHRAVRLVAESGRLRSPGSPMRRAPSTRRIRCST
jgi:phage portal protein BeeE